jgi:AraC-like DNA-binding protein
MQPSDLQKTAKEQPNFPYPVGGNFELANYAKYYQFHMYAPSSDLAPFVAYFSVFRPTFPEDFILEFSQLLQTPGASLLFSPSESVVLGVATKQVKLRAKHTDVKIRVIFRPGGFYAFRHDKMSALVNCAVPIAHLFPEADQHFIEQLLSVQDGEQIVGRLEWLLRTRSPRSDDNIALIDNILTVLQAEDEPITVAGIAHRFGRSERSLQHLFSTYVGVGVKWITIRSRVLKAIQQAQAPDDVNWAQIAADLGYSSQSHLINEFRELVGQAPSQFKTSWRS